MAPAPRPSREVQHVHVLEAGQQPASFKPHGAGKPRPEIMPGYGLPHPEGRQTVRVFHAGLRKATWTTSVVPAAKPAALAAR